MTHRYFHILGFWCSETAFQTIDVHPALQRRVQSRTIKQETRRVQEGTTDRYEYHRSFDNSRCHVKSTRPHTHAQASHGQLSNSLYIICIPFITRFEPPHPSYHVATHVPEYNPASAPTQGPVFISSTA